MITFMLRAKVNVFSTYSATSAQRHGVSAQAVPGQWRVGKTSRFRALNSSKFQILAVQHIRPSRD